jgi:hypothetical protein
MDNDSTMDVTSVSPDMRLGDSEALNPPPPEKQAVDNNQDPPPTSFFSGIHRYQLRTRLGGLADVVTPITATPDTMGVSGVAIG